MTGSLQRRFWVLLASAAAAFGVWKFVPGTDLDRTAFTTVAAGFVNPPLFVEGQGTHAIPWKLRSFSSETKPDKRQAPVIVSLGDDLEGFFQASPPAPIDLAVVLKNFQRLGAKKAATAAVMAWETADAVELTAFESSLDGFDSLVMAAPLSRGAIASAMPPAFRRASIPLSAIPGDSSGLPVVNRVPVQGVVLKGKNATAGFSVLDSETASGFPPLLARWEDRVVFSFPLLTVLQRLDLPPEGMEIRLGEYLKLGANGPIVPIDEYGRLALPLKPISAYTEIPAQALIDGGDDLFPKQAPDPVILRDDRTAADPGTRAFSRMLSATVAAIASDGGIAPSRSYPRLARDWEFGILGGVAVFLTLFCGLSNFSRNLGAIVLAVGCIGAQWTALGMASVWLPMIPALAAIAATVVVSMMVAIRVPVGARIPELATEDEPTPEPEPEPELKAEPVAVVEVVQIKKAPAKKSAKSTAKTSPKKAAPKKGAKKEPAKKAAKKTGKSPGEKKPPQGS